VPAAPRHGPMRVAIVVYHPLLRRVSPSPEESSAGLLYTRKV